MKPEDLAKAAEDLNEVLQLKPKIDYALPSADVLHLIKDGALCMYTSDKLKPETIEVLRSIDWKKEDFENLDDDKDPIPAFLMHGIYDENAPEGKPPKRKPRKTKAEKVVITKTEPVTVAAEPEEAEEHLDKDPAKETPTEKKQTTPSAYGTVLALMGPDPTLTLPEVYDMMRELGFDMNKSNGSIKTAHSIFRKCYQILKKHGHIKKK